MGSCFWTDVGFPKFLLYGSHRTIPALFPFPWVKILLGQTQLRKHPLPPSHPPSLWDWETPIIGCIQIPQGH
jgi:hypothetical protein